jgi:hypothetical protein
MVEQSLAAGVPVMLVDPVSNLKDCPPFKVEVDPKLTESQRERVRQLLELAVAENVATEESIDHLQETLHLDPRHAGAWYLVGQAYLAAGDDVQAKLAFVRAKDEDVCPLRAIERFREIIDEAGRTTHSPVVRARDLFEKHSPHGIPGDELLLDHVHPTISGQQMIAELLLDSMVQRGLVRLPNGWKEQQQKLYSEHFAKLDTPYFARGQEHLEGLRKWAQGRVTKLRSGE